jgi:hypothetical protein
MRSYYLLTSIVFFVFMCMSATQSQGAPLSPGGPLIVESWSPGEWLAEPPPGRPPSEPPGPPRPDDGGGDDGGGR